MRYIIVVWFPDEYKWKLAHWSHSYEDASRWMRAAVKVHGKNAKMMIDVDQINRHKQLLPERAEEEPPAPELMGGEL